MNRGGVLLAFAGLVLAAVLFARENVHVVAQLLLVAGPGLVLASAVHVVPMTLNAIAWQRLFAMRAAVSLRRLTLATWLRESVNGLLPVARVGGELVAYRIVRQRGVATAEAASTLVADMAISVMTQAAFTLAGLAILVRAGVERTVTVGVAVGAMMLTVAGIAFIAAQRGGIVTTVTRLVNRAFAGRLAAAVEGSVTLEDAMRAIYARRRDVAACAAWQCIGWIAGSLEIYLALRFLGQDRTLVEAIMVEALIQAVSSAAFLVPAALGVQEGGFLIIGTAIGLDAPTALALAAARRVRDVVVFFPGLLAWQWFEARSGPATRSATVSPRKLER